MVDLVDREHLDLTLHCIYGQEVTAGIEHHTAIGEAGVVLDLHSGDFPSSRFYSLLAFYSGREELQQRLCGIEQTIGSTSLSNNCIGSHFEGVGFCALNAFVQEEGDRFTLASFLQGETSRAAYFFGEEFGYLASALTLGCETGVGIERECALAYLHLYWGRDDVDFLCPHHQG